MLSTGTNAGWCVALARAIDQPWQLAVAALVDLDARGQARVEDDGDRGRSAG